VPFPALPPAFVLQTALNDFYVTYELNAYTDAPERMPWIFGELHQNIQTTIPADYLPPGYEAPAIRIMTTEVKGKKESA
jgi:hypothetical protein